MYIIAFGLSLFASLLSHLFNRPRASKPTPKHADSDLPLNNSFLTFQANYLFVYLLAVTADWLQGPFVYALYSHYGFAKTQIARLYIAGFASSALFGTFIAALADKYGRRNNALLYCLIYSLSCLTKHSPNFYILLLGRLLGGIAYSILFAAFEAWLVHEHRTRGFDPSTLAGVFAKAQFGNGIVAICSGVIAGMFAQVFGKIAPFDLSVGVLVALAMLIARSWPENYGDSSQSVHGGLMQALKTVRNDEKILLLGVSQAAFEGAMYTFTFVWTPALQSAKGQVGEIPHGLIFSTFMAATMIGSNLFAYASQRVKIEGLMRNVFVIGALVFTATYAFPRVEVVYGGFLVFEVLCGVYFPGMATMRAPYIPEESRSAILTFFRIPLNIIVVVALYEDLDVTAVFFMCAILMIIAVCSQQRLMKLARYAPYEGDISEISTDDDNEDKDEDEDEDDKV